VEEVRMNETNSTTLSSERAMEILRYAFKPLTCVAQFQNVGTLVVFEVSDGTKRILKHGIPAAFAHNGYNLRTQIMEVRRAIEKKGMRLAPWEMPSTLGRVVRVTAQIVPPDPESGCTGDS
jgi:hypothetical protein